MSKNKKMMKCSNCNNLIEEKTKMCQHCGAKNKKPIYKRFWVIALAIIVLLLVFGPKGGKQDSAEKFDWSDIKLSSILPKPESNKATIYSNTNDYLWIQIFKITESEYDEYVKDCKESGFTIDVEDNYGYNAFNSEGYELSVNYMSDESIYMTVDAPVEMNEIIWPISEIVQLVPLPNSSYGEIITENSDMFNVNIGETTIDEYNDYVQACLDSGFNIDYNKDKNYYSAYNENGYYLSVSYEGFNIINISIQAPSIDEEIIPEPTKQPDIENDENIEEDNTDLVDGMHPEFKKQMDAYEVFFNDYIDFMIKYSESSDDVGMLVDYLDYIGKFASQMETMDELQTQEMNNAETKYYIEVTSRITLNLLDVTQ